jgi:hypothetical protein
MNVRVSRLKIEIKSREKERRGATHKKEDAWCLGRERGGRGQRGGRGRDRNERRRISHAKHHDIKAEKENLIAGAGNAEHGGRSQE